MSLTVARTLKIGAISAGMWMALAGYLFSQTPDAAALPQAPAPKPAPLNYEMPKSHNPLNAYMPDTVPEPMLNNSARIDQLVRDGKLFLSLKDAIELALEDNLDLAIARYNLPIAKTDILRTQAGGFFRGVNTGVVQGTPGGGVGGFGTAPQEPVLVGQPAARAAPEPAHRDSFNRRLERALRSHPYDPFIGLPEAMSIRHSSCEPADLWRSVAATEYGLRSTQFSVRRFRQEPVLMPLSQHARQSTNSPFFNLSPSLNSTFRFQIGKNCWPDLALAQTCAT